ncbi:RidA family protein [Alkaliphilus serpentinus]|uniref:RidA family protein n=1 Tax=Alkaliphilus serpentinus TaxID=1482731 RepID=A0A833HPN9_9FIRM|nr:Rid family detoxifying hydrolase [Alkaliphilus serpentinus]KAB3531100.1 RidA family protein [Alkaliphilus serpentinus]
MTRKAYNSKDAATVGPYSHAVEANDTIYFSGQTPIDSKTGQLVEGDIKKQTQQCFDNLFKVLAEAGLDRNDVIKVNVFLTHMDNFKDMNEVYEKQFSRPFPARTTIGVAELPLGAAVEIEMIAQKQKK